MFKGKLTVQPGVHLAGNPAGQAWNGLKLFQRGAEEGLRGAEVFKDLLFARRSHAGQLVEDGAGHLRAAELAMVGAREAVRLVPYTLQEVQLRRVALEDHRLGASRLEDLLITFGERAQGDVRQFLAHPKLLVDRDDRGELTFPTIEQYEVRGLGELLVADFEAFEPSPYHLGHAREVVCSFDGLDPEPPVLVLGGPPALEDHHRSDRVRPHGVRDVVAFYPHRELWQRQLLAQRV